MSKQSDIIYQLRQGENQKAIAQLYECFPMIRKFIFNHGGNAADAQDVFQEALLILYRNAQKPDFTLTCAASTYIYSIVRFLWKDTLRKKNKEVLVEDDIREVSVAFEDKLERSEMQEEKKITLAKIFDQLGQKCQQILQAYYYQKMSMKDIAQQFGYGSVNSVKTQKYKCIERAKKNAKSI